MEWELEQEWSWCARASNNDAATLGFLGFLFIYLFYFKNSRRI